MSVRVSVCVLVSMPFFSQSVFASTRILVFACLPNCPFMRLSVCMYVRLTLTLLRWRLPIRQIVRLIITLQRLAIVNVKLVH